jgi:ATP-dependent helicase/nuclease subunit B
VSYADFLETIRRHVEETAIPVGRQAEGGVQVLDAMAARGLSFRALFLLHLNERVFPRHIREDAFLRDPIRRMLDADLGYKIQEKLAGFEEEQLLFYLLANAARERLTLVTLRTDEAGRPLVPSGYLDEVRRIAPGLKDADLVIPGRWTDRAAHPRLPEFGAAWLMPSECLRGEFVARRRPAPALIRLHPAARIVEPGFAVVEALDRSTPELAEYDGLTGELPQFWESLKGGLAPTKLERYAVCPFRFFAESVLKIRPLEEPEQVGALAPVELGTLAHAILRDVYRIRRDEGFRDRSPGAVLREAAEPLFADYARTYPVGYPLLWELTTQRLVAALELALMDDLDVLGAGPGAPWVPLLFETPMSGLLTLELGDGQETFTLQGRIDRLDWSPSQRAYRVIDYKYTVVSDPRRVESNLERAAVRGKRLQPACYLLMASESFKTRPPEAFGDSAPAPEGVWFYYVMPNAGGRESGVVKRVRFPGDAWTSALRAPLERTLAVVLEGVRSGRFFIYPGGHCDSCDARPLCRKNHQPSWWRARADHQRVDPFRRLQRADPGERGDAVEPDRPHDADKAPASRSRAPRSGRKKGTS